MSLNQSYSIKEGINIMSFVDSVSRKLAEEEFEVETLVMGPAGASILIKKDRGGFKDFSGLGFECRITMYICDGKLNYTIEHNYTKQIIALWLGMVTCGTFTVTGIIGLAFQSSITAKIVEAIVTSL